MTTPVTFTDMLRRLLRADGQGRAAKTVEIYGLQDLLTCLWTWAVWRREFGGGRTGPASS